MHFGVGLLMKGQSIVLFFRSIKMLTVALKKDYKVQLIPTMKTCFHIIIFYLFYFILFYSILFSFLQLQWRPPPVIATAPNKEKHDSTGETENEPQRKPRRSREKEEESEPRPQERRAQLLR